MTTTHKAKASGTKKEDVQTIRKLFKEYPIVGLVNMENLPALQLMRIKRSLRGRVILMMPKKRIIKIALEGLDLPNIKSFSDKVTGMPALLFTKENPFALYKIISKNKSMSSAKPGQIAPTDLIVPAGPTPFVAGPMIGELSQLGLKAMVKDGKIEIREEKVLVEEGQVISDKAAGLLAKLGVEPMEIMLNLMLTYEKGEILTKEILGVSEEQYVANIKMAAVESLNLAVFAGYTTPETTDILVKKAYMQAKAVAKEGKVLTDENAGEMLAEANATSEKIKAQMPADAAQAIQ